MWEQEVWHFVLCDWWITLLINVTIIPSSHGNPSALSPAVRWTPLDTTLWPTSLASRLIYNSSATHHTTFPVSIKATIGKLHQGQVTSSPSNIVTLTFITFPSSCQTQSKQWLVQTVYHHMSHRYYGWYRQYTITCHIGIVAGTDSTPSHVT